MEFAKGESSTDLTLPMCSCGLPAKIFTSKTERNPGKRFYGCQLYKVAGTQHCKFFRWIDIANHRCSTEEYVVEIEEKENLIHQLRIDNIEIRRHFEYQLETAERVIYRQRLVIAGLSGMLVCAFGVIVFGRFL
ncbi:uncharacterized protein LOC111828670 [Capsella rubella]|uniref:uncharacterized protein LOC111828670 n=1 Tax=Capsella rubella TaxID=81985 RepID=UPI000CD568AA|nr:uncharacterized protein LOC111828670 [Capsella rubella]